MVESAHKVNPTDIVEGVTRIRVLKRTGKGTQFVGLALKVLEIGEVVGKEPITEPHVRGVKGKDKKHEEYDRERTFTVPISKVALDD